MKEVLRVVQRQNDVRVSVAMELPFVKEGEGDEEVHFFGIIRNLSAGGNLYGDPGSLEGR